MQILLRVMTRPCRRIVGAVVEQRRGGFERLTWPKVLALATGTTPPDIDAASAQLAEAKTHLDEAGPRPAPPGHCPRSCRRIVGALVKLRRGGCERLTLPKVLARSAPILATGLHLVNLPRPWPWRPGPFHPGCSR